MSETVENNQFKLLDYGRCEVCGGALKDLGLEIYVCSKCGHEMMTEFGKLKKYINENGSATASEVSDATGIPLTKISKYLREGRIEIPENSPIFIKCERCGTDIRYGKFCPECAIQLQKQFSSAVSQLDVGEKPKKAESSGKMRFVGKNDR